MDSSTDSANIDDELFLVIWCNTDGQIVCTNMSYLCVARPKKVNSQGIFDCLATGLHSLGTQDISAEHCKFLVGIGTVGAAAYVAAARLKCLVEKEVPWLYWSWCSAHHVELAVKDALKGTCFNLIDEMLLCLYYNI